MKKPPLTAVYFCPSGEGKFFCQRGCVNYYDTVI
nr:MAG TPA: hypothetical protein [Caudoviricetes sp.]